MLYIVINQTDWREAFWTKDSDFPKTSQMNQLFAVVSNLHVLDLEIKFK